MIRKAQLYRGIVILPADNNSSGIAWRRTGGDRVGLSGTPSIPLSLLSVRREH